MSRIAVDFKRNYLTLEEDLLALNADIKAMVAESTGRPLVASDPV